MPLYVAVHTTFLTHEKTEGLSAGAVRLWLFALLYSKQHETYGMVSERKLRALCAGNTDDEFAVIVAELVGAGLWVSQVEPGSEGKPGVTRYGQTEAKWNEYQSSRETLAAYRSDAAERQRRYRLRQKEVQSVTGDVTRNVTPVTRNATVTPRERRETEEKEKEKGSEGAA